MNQGSKALKKVQLSLSKMGLVAKVSPQLGEKEVQLLWMWPQLVFGKLRRRNWRHRNMMKTPVGGMTINQLAIVFSEICIPFMFHHCWLCHCWISIYIILILYMSSHSWRGSLQFSESTQTRKHMVFFNFQPTNHPIEMGLFENTTTMDGWS